MEIFHLYEFRKMLDPRSALEKEIFQHSKTLYS